MRRAVTVERVDGDGLLLRGREDLVLDVLFDGRRIWSFWTLRDTEPGDGGRSIAWPVRLHRFLDGRSQVTVREHVGETVLFDGELSFGAGEGRVAVVGRHGEPLSFDKAGRLSATFAQRDNTPLLDGIERLLADLSDLGIAAFPAYGTLLGAVREGDFLGHDSDADLGYVSTETYPVDVVRESFRLQRCLVERGYDVYRYSGAALRVTVQESDGVRRGLDVFGGFLAEGRLYLMGEVGTDFERDWIFPLGTCTLAGRTLPAPARPEKLLEAMYGPSWQVPDPAFRFETPRSTTERLNAWFRGIAVHRQRWEREYAASRGDKVRDRPPSALARMLHREVGADAAVLDVGAGRGRDALFLAAQGRRVTAYDYVPWAANGAVRVAEAQGYSLESRRLNLLELRSVLSEGAWLAAEPQPRAILARNVLDHTDGNGRDHLGRFASMALRAGGRLYAEFWTGPGEAGEAAEEVPLEAAVALVERHGGSIVRASEMAPGEGTQPVPYGVGRLVAQWG